MNQVDDKKNDETLEYFMNNTVEGCLIRDACASDQIDGCGLMTPLNNHDALIKFIQMYGVEKALNILTPLMNLGYDVGILIRNMYHDNMMVNKTHERSVIEFLVHHNRYDIYMLTKFIQSQHKIRYIYLNPTLMASMVKCAIHMGSSIEDLEKISELFRERHHDATAQLFLREKDRVLAEIYMIWDHYTHNSEMRDDQIYVREIMPYIHQPST